MMFDNITFKAIGSIKSPFKELSNMPIQPKGAKGIEGVIELLPEYADALKDLDGFSHIIVLYYFHKSPGFKSLITPFMDSVKRGLFATRAPRRPNPIGLSILELKRVENNRIFVDGIDILDETPLLDIKPYATKFDEVSNAKNGWLDRVKESVSEKRSDNRFI